MILFSLLALKVVSACGQDTAQTNLHQKILRLDSLAIQMDSLLTDATEHKIEGGSEIGHYEGIFKTLAERDNIATTTISFNFRGSQITIYSTHSKVFKLRTGEGSYYYISEKLYEKSKAEVKDPAIVKKLLALVQINNTVSTLLTDQ